MLLFSVPDFIWISNLQVSSYLYSFSLCCFHSVISLQYDLREKIVLWYTLSHWSHELDFRFQKLLSLHLLNFQRPWDEKLPSIPFHPYCYGNNSPWNGRQPAVIYTLNKTYSKRICYIPKSSIYSSHWVCVLGCSSQIKWGGSITATNFSLTAVNCGGVGGFLWFFVSCFVFTFLPHFLSLFLNILISRARRNLFFFLIYYSLCFVCENTLRIRYRRIPCVT